MSPLADLRSLSPRRPLTRAEANRVAELQANRLLDRAGLTKPPTPMSLVTNLPQVAVDFLKGVPVSGSAHWTGAYWMLVLNASEPTVRQRFSLCHELKHVVDHPQREVLYSRLRPMAGKDPAEAVADYFAACLLMPRVWVRRAWTGGLANVPTLAALLDVSQAAMRVRLAWLGLIDEAEVAA
jgi:Zn-dependent peptidase ImmA (M78 family)